MAADMSLFELIAGASTLVQLVMLLLLVASVASWAVIFRKQRSLKQAIEGANEFEERFWAGGNIRDTYNQVNRTQPETGGLERIFRAGFREFSRMNQGGAPADTVVEASQRAMRVAMSRELDELETSLPFLATVGSTSPYVGLFGTVWGIMNAFRSLGKQGQATIAQVAPPIAEALIATALGLFAAIPAVIAYNRYVNQVERLTGRYEIFIDQFTSVLQRHAHTQGKE